MKDAMTQIIEEVKNISDNDQLSAREKIARIKEYFEEYNLSNIQQIEIMEKIIDDKYNLIKKQR